MVLHLILYFDGKLTIRMVAVIVLTLVINLESDGNAAKWLACVVVWNERKVWPKLGKGHGHSRSRLHVIVLETCLRSTIHSDTIWNIGETGDINIICQPVTGRFYVFLIHF